MYDQGGYWLRRMKNTIRCQTHKKTSGFSGGFFCAKSTKKNVNEAMNEWWFDT